jgi:hypothetical protein
MEAWRFGDDALSKEGNILTPPVGRQSAFLLNGQNNLDLPGLLMEVAGDSGVKWPDRSSSP